MLGFLPYSIVIARDTYIQFTAIKGAATHAGNDFIGCPIWNHQVFSSCTGLQLVCLAFQTHSVYKVAKQD